MLDGLNHNDARGKANPALGHTLNRPQDFLKALGVHRRHIKDIPGLNGAEEALHQYVFQLKVGVGHGFSEGRLVRVRPKAKAVGHHNNELAPIHKTPPDLPEHLPHVSRVAHHVDQKGFVEGLIPEGELVFMDKHRFAGLAAGPGGGALVAGHGSCEIRRLLLEVL